MHEHVAKDDFNELLKRIKPIVEKMNWFEKYGKEWLFFILRGIGFLCSYLIFTRPGLLFKSIGMLGLSYFYTGITITGIHETSHGCFVHSKRWNRKLSYFFSDFWGGQSSVWWHTRHVRLHHTYTNIPEKETEGDFYYNWINKYVFFFLLPFLALVWHIAFSIKFLKNRPKELVKFLILVTAGLAAHTLLFTTVLTVPYAIAAMFLMRSLFAPIFMHVALFNHIDLEFFKERQPWVDHQTRTTRNLKKGWFLTGMGGNAFVESHVEHHLFPAFSNAMLAKIRKPTLTFLKEKGYTYVEQSYFTCLRNCLKYYKTIFSERKPTIENTVEEFL